MKTFIATALFVAAVISLPLSPAARADDSAPHSADAPAGAPVGGQPSTGTNCFLPPVTIVFPAGLALPAQIILEYSAPARPGPVRDPGPNVVVTRVTVPTIAKKGMVNIREIGSGTAKQYIVDIGKGATPSVQLRGTDAGGGTYQGSARFGERVSMDGMIMTAGGVYVAHDTDIALVKVELNSGVQLVGGVRQAVRAGNGSIGGGVASFVYGSGPAAGLRYATDGGSVLRLNVSGMPAVSSAHSGSLSGVFSLGVSYEWK